MRLIDADALRAKLTDYKTITEEPNADISSMTVAAKIVEEAPTVDAVQVVRCRECKYCAPVGEFIWCNHHLDTVPTGIGYCADGER